MSEPAAGSIYLPPGTLIGEFRVEQLLGEGGMATVYAATHTVIGKKAAVKIMSQQLCSDPAAVERFVSEARAVNQIGHPNIVDAFAFGKLDDGRSYIVMEWLQGTTLQERLAEGALPLAESVDILDQIADALEAAHEKGIIHRDLKPDNIFLTKVRGRRTLVKLLDFGIAKLTANDSAQSKTKTGLFVGTPTHISPEQARSKNVDARTDIYALGVTAYQMILGRLPFDADNAMDLVTMHLRQVPPTPSSIWPEVPPPLESLLVRLLEKDKELRPTLVETQEVLAQLLSELRLRMPSGDFPIYRGTTPTPPGTPVIGTPPPRRATPPVGFQRTISGVGPRQVTPPVGVAVHEPPPVDGAGHEPPTEQPYVASEVHPFASTTPAGRIEFFESAPTTIPTPAPALKAQPLPPDPPTDEVSLRPRRRALPIVVGLAAVSALALAIGARRSPAPSAPPVVAPVAPPAAITPSPAPAGQAPAPATPRVMLMLELNVAGTIQFDGVVVAENVESVAIQVAKPGTHELVVTAPRYKPHRATVLTAADPVLLSISLQSVTPDKVAAKPGAKAAKPGAKSSHSREYMLDPFGNK